MFFPLLLDLYISGFQVIVEKADTSDVPNIDKQKYVPHIINYNLYSPFEVLKPL